jgi:peptidoglycan/xylan/chitin deacetylase (PgdA/CDA1 family)
MNEPVIGFYRCPESLVNLDLAGQLSSELGYFSFGDGAVCFGRCSVGSPTRAVGSDLRDLSQHVTSDGSSLHLPFDPSEIVDNLRLERYATGEYARKRAILSSEAIRRVYYFFRPVLSVSVRKHVQRLALRNWQELPFPAWPVDRTVELVLERLLFLSLKDQSNARIPFIWFWPEGASSCVIVTHDVETKDGVRSIQRLMDIDEAFGIKASFQVIPQKQYAVAEEELDAIGARGFEVCIHDLNHDSNLFDHRSEFLLRAQSINRYVREYRALGFRAGRMYRNADWYEALDISYDMSIPNVAHLDPQRGGCCTVFPYFIGRILELPLTTTQDHSLFHILGDYSIELWKKQIALIMEKHGLVSFVVHPDYIMQERALDVYKALLHHVADLRAERNVWVALPREVNRWWRERSQMRLVPEGGGWRFDGPGQERARIAYASIKDGQLVYTLPDVAGRARAATVS